jgi:hypothetical protein
VTGRCYEFAQSVFLTWIRFLEPSEPLERRVGPTVSDYETAIRVVQRARCNLKDVLGRSLSSLTGNEMNSAKNGRASSDEEVRDASSK